MTALRALTFDEIDEVAGANPTAQITTNINLGTGQINSITATCGLGYYITPNFALNTPSFQSTVTNATNYTCSPLYSNSFNIDTFTPEDVAGFTMFGFAGSVGYSYS
jgi:hypothetical protein